MKLVHYAFLDIIELACSLYPRLGGLAVVVDTRLGGLAVVVGYSFCFPTCMHTVYCVCHVCELVECKNIHGRKL